MTLSVKMKIFEAELYEIQWFNKLRNQLKKLYQSDNKNNIYILFTKKFFFKLIYKLLI